MVDMSLPLDHQQRIACVRLSLDGLSVGDALGEQFFHFPEFVGPRTVPAPRWRYTDDTAMALSIAEVLDRFGRIEQDELARLFADRYAADPHRGYGAGAQELLEAIARGTPWREASIRAFRGEGSLGNGAAMRVAPVGACFADDLDAVVREADASAEITHAHPEGRAGAVAVAVAAATAWNRRGQPPDEAGRRMLETCLERTPRGGTRDGITVALKLGRDATVQDAVAVLGNGSQLTAADTVPYCLWCAARHLDSYVDAFWTTVSGLGDRDTTCAIVGGIVVLFVGLEAIPEAWLYSREPLGFRSSASL
ncbi:MAG TPA: ADP-ribosylglycohydrolase family protein [Planctomycetaceae bacterium]|nr:ADP-ribosylglycohydrolase family protein [Planctomycetaceae bacterium]